MKRPALWIVGVLLQMRNCGLERLETLLLVGEEFTDSHLALLATDMPRSISTPGLGAGALSRHRLLELRWRKACQTRKSVSPHKTVLCWAERMGSAGPATNSCPELWIYLSVERLLFKLRSLVCFFHEDSHLCSVSNGNKPLVLHSFQVNVLTILSATMTQAHCKVAAPKSRLYKNMAKCHKVPESWCTHTFPRHHRWSLNRLRETHPSVSFISQTKRNIRLFMHRRIIWDEGYCLLRNQLSPPIDPENCWKFRGKELQRGRDWGTTDKVPKKFWR